MVSGNVNRRFQPEFGFSIWAKSMNMRPALFSGKEKEPIALAFKYRRTHADILSAAIPSCKPILALS